MGSGKDTVATSVRLTRRGHTSLLELADQAGLTQTAILETLIRKAVGDSDLVTPDVSTVERELLDEQNFLDDEVIIKRLGLDDPEIRAELVKLKDEDWQYLYSNLKFVCEKCTRKK